MLCTFGETSNICTRTTDDKTSLLLILFHWYAISFLTETISGTMRGAVVWVSWLQWHREIRTRVSPLSLGAHARAGDFREAARIDPKRERESRRGFPARAPRLPNRNRKNRRGGSAFCPAVQHAPPRGPAGNILSARSRCGRLASSTCKWK